MDMAVDTIGDVGVVSVLVEELDASNVDEFKSSMTPVLEAHTKLVFDLHRLRFTDSSGLGAFLSCLRHVNARGSDVKLCGLSPQVRAVFELVRLHRVFDIYSTPEEAVRAFAL